MSKKAERHLALSRRRFLHGLGACLALPAMETLLGRSSFASVLPGGAPAPATTASGAPLRMAFMYFPNGAIRGQLTPSTG